MLERLKKFAKYQNIGAWFSLEYISVSVILLISFILRVFRIDQILNFNYDQGRDALVIWDLIHSHKFFLIGPTTGLPGIFRGPFYYYLIAPFYLLGKGSPVWPAVMLAVLSVIALALMYYLAKKIGGVITGFIALILGTFSFEIIYAARWLSNPTPMLLLSMILVWMMFLIQNRKKWAWIVLSFILGLSFFHFGSSGELFYFPAVAIFAVWIISCQGFGRKSSLNWKVIFYSAGAFLFTFLPLFIFNLKHGNILANNVSGQVEGGKSFGVSNWQFVLDRLSLVWTYFSALLFHSPFAKEYMHLAILALVGIYFLPKLVKNDKVKVLLLLLLSVTIGLLFYQGNFGNFYQYYLTGYYLIFLLLVSVILGEVFKSNWVGKIFVLYFLLFFLLQNWSWVKPYITTSDSEPGMIMFGNQKSAIDWIYKDAGSRAFNVDEYVPPVIPYSYNYLYTWLGTYKYDKLPVDSQVSLLYTLYEVDPPHPERLQAWLTRQARIGKVIKEQTFGGITVQERERILYSK
jgi:4-amino-4-deoxy-L-arabinose transferase-like glycosyltransferase